MPRARNAKFRRLTPLSVEEWTRIANSLKDSSLALKQAAEIVARHMGSKSADSLRRFDKNLRTFRGRLEKFAREQHPEWDDCSAAFLDDHMFEQGPRIAGRGEDQILPVADWLMVGGLLGPIHRTLVDISNSVGPSLGVAQADLIGRFLDGKFFPVRDELETRAIEQHPEHQAEISRAFGDRPTAGVDGANG